MSSNVVRISGLAAPLGGVLVAVYAAIAASMPRGCIGEIECATRQMRDTGSVDTLGFELLVDEAWREGMRWSEVAPEGSATSLMLVSWQTVMLPGMHWVVVMATGNIRAIHEELFARGIDLELPPTQTPRGAQAMFRDPFGNPLMLWEHAVARDRSVPAKGPVFRLMEGNKGVRFS
jgi:predicted enzyme related to lactoylglutathione lyase